MPARATYLEMCLVTLSPITLDCVGVTIYIPKVINIDTITDHQMKVNASLIFDYFCAGKHEGGGAPAQLLKNRRMGPYW